MKYIELQTAFELEIDQLDNNLTKPTTSDIEYWLMAGLDKFIKTRYSGMNSKHEGVEQSQKRVDDLRKLLLSVTYSGTNLIYTQYAIVTGDYSVYSGANQIIATLTSEAVSRVNNSLYTVTLPDNYFLKLGEITGIVPVDGSTIPCWQKKDGQYITKYVTPIHETTLTIGQRLENSLSQHNLHNATAKPLSIQIDNKICFYTDGQYKVRDVSVHYIKYPSKIDIHTTPFDEYTEMPKHTHIEIVKMAVLMYMENKGNPRYQSYLNEVDMME